MPISAVLPADALESDVVGCPAPGNSQPCKPDSQKQADFVNAVPGCQVQGHGIALLTVIPCVAHMPYRFCCTAQHI
jgi:hypothetical protein